MYILGLGRDFQARHFLVGGDWGPENDPHDHAYRVEVRLTSEALDPHGYIVDLDDLNALLDRVVDRYQGRLLNDLPEFTGLNPSIEHLSRFFCQQLAAGLAGQGLKGIEVRIWETDKAWAAYREGFR